MEKPLPKRMVRPFLESIRDFNREAREIDPKTEAKRIKTQEDLEEIEELTMHSVLSLCDKSDFVCCGAHQRRSG